jgi:hypothetical protein
MRVNVQKGTSIYVQRETEIVSDTAKNLWEIP